MPEDPIDRTTWDRRADGTEKGNGFLGILKRPDGRVSSEISIGIPRPNGRGAVPPWGEGMEIPTLVPTLDASEISYLLNMKDSDKIRASIVQKAVDFAYQRIAEGKPVFAQPGEQYYHIHPQFKRLEVPTTGFNDATIRPMAGTLSNLAKLGQR
jgi:hypothetical protein